MLLSLPPLAARPFPQTLVVKAVEIFGGFESLLRNDKHKHQRQHSLFHRFKLKFLTSAHNIFFKNKVWILNGTPNFVFFI
jgi:hypothetical protein